MPRQVARRTAAPGARPAPARGRAAPADQEVASIRYGDMIPGGLLDDVNAIVVSARFVIWDYGQGKVEKTFLNLTLKPDDDEAEHEQYFSAADPDTWVPNEDGTSLVRPAESESTKPLNNNTVFAQLMASIENAGFPPEMLEGNDISVLDGLYGHWRREAQPPRKGLKREDPERELTVLVLDNLISMPGEAPKAPTRAAARVAGKPAARRPAPPAAAAPAAGAPVDELGDKAVGAIIARLEKEGPTPKSALTGLFFSTFKQDANRKELLALATDEQWLLAMAEMGYWAYEDGTLVPA
ncbi:MAG: hypothetical protein V3S55_13385 [Nitrospiraceae bacterium]